MLFLNARRSYHILTKFLPLLRFRTFILLSFRTSILLLARLVYYRFLDLSIRILTLKCHKCLLFLLKSDLTFLLQLFIPLFPHLDILLKLFPLLLPHRQTHSRILPFNFQTLSYPFPSVNLSSLSHYFFICNLFIEPYLFHF